MDVGKGKLLARLLAATGITEKRVEVREGKRAATADLEMLAPIVGGCCLEHKIATEKELLVLKMEEKLEDVLVEREDETLAESLTQDELQTLVTFFESKSYKKYVASREQVQEAVAKVIDETKKNVAVLLEETEKKLRAEAAKANPAEGKKTDPLSN